MTVRAGREILASPGPTNIPDEVLQAMHRQAVEIYDGPLVALTDGLLFLAIARPLARTASLTAWPAPSGTQASFSPQVRALDFGMTERNAMAVH